MTRDTLISADENRHMFDAIARRYDLMNRLISMGLDRGWRRRTVQQLGPVGGGRYLDVGTGTGDLALEILQQQNAATVVGVDPATEMLDIARVKVARAGLAAAITFREGDVMALPFPDRAFAGVVTGFCIRNVEDRQRALVEMHRVLEPGGRLLILELSVPAGGVTALGHRLYSRSLLPLAASLFSQTEAYRYLVESVRDFPPPRRFLGKLATAGFAETRAVPLTGGTVSIFKGVRP